MDKLLIEELLKYIEVMEELHDTHLRSHQEIIEDGNMPDIYFRLKELEPA